MKRFVLVAPLFLSLAACGSSPEPPTLARTAKTSSALQTVPPGPNKVEGIDVSHYQGSIDWASQKAQGRLFGVASVGDGTYEDPTFATNWADMKSAGVIRGAYQFFEPGDDPIVQADILIGKVGVLGDGDLPATIDVEVTGGQSAATIADRVGKWLARVEAGTGRKPMIYTGPYFWEDNVGSAAYVDNPLWVADYGPPAPLVPSPWQNFKIWQYSDSGGSLDLDRFNGSLAELQAFARPPDIAPRGYLDGADCTEVHGWSQDEDTPKTAIAVHLYFDDPAGTKGAPSLALNADVSRKDLCGPLGSCDHGFALPTPLGLMDGKAHKVFAYGIDSAGGANTLLTDSPKSFTCAAPAPPLAPPSGIKRWIPNMTVLGAWKFSQLTDMVHYEAAQIDAFTQGPDLPATPEVIIADDGSPSVWVVDGGKRRHVVDPASMAAWRFGAAKKTPAAMVQAMVQGPDWRPTPFLMQSTAAPAVYVVDVAPDTPPGTSPGGGGPGASSGPPSPGGSSTPESGGVDANAPAGSSGGCSVGGSSSRDSLGLGGALLAGALAMRRRRRRSPAVVARVVR